MRSGLSGSEQRHPSSGGVQIRTYVSQEQTYFLAGDLFIYILRGEQEV